MNIIDKSVHKFDAWQQRRRFLSFFVGLIKGYSDVNGGVLVVRLTYAVFTTVFPLLLLLITVLTLVLAGDPGLKAKVLNSTFNEFPVVASQLGNDIHALRRDSVIGLIVSFVFLLYGTTGLASTAINVMEQVWDIDPNKRLNYIKRLGHGFVFLAVLAIGVALTTLLSSFGTFSRRNLILTLIALILAFAVNIGIYLAAFRVLTPKSIRTHDLIPGAVIGGTTWTILQALGGYIVGHYLRRANATYGVFGTVLGLIVWLYIGSQLTVYSVVLNRVIKQHLWPRQIFS